MPLMRVEVKKVIERLPDKEEFHDRQEEVGKEGVRGWLNAVLGEEGGKRAWDDLTRPELDAKKVVEAQMKEVERIRKNCTAISSSPVLMPLAVLVCGLYGAVNLTQSRYLFYMTLTTWPSLHWCTFYVYFFN